MFQKLFTAKQIKEIDSQTILLQNLSSEVLMERAATNLFNQLKHKISRTQKIHLFCGKGNNGGDGLVLARLFYLNNYNISVHIVSFSPKASTDFDINLQKLINIKVPVNEFIPEKLPEIQSEDIIIDGIFGTGLSRPANGIAKQAIEFINTTNAKVFSIDIPSGLYADKSNDPNDSIVQSDLVYSFQFPKISFFFPENDKYIKEFETIDIGLEQSIIDKLPSIFLLLTEQITNKIKKYSKFSYKNTFGHAVIIGGSKGMTGAPVLASKAALRIGAGLVSNFLPEIGYQISQSQIPEVMTLTDKHPNIITKINLPNNVTAVGIGPGMGQHPKTQKALKRFFKKYKLPTVLDADALNIVAKHPDWLKCLPKNTIITPHLGEFRRLVGDWKNDTEKLEILKKFAIKHQFIVVLKGAYTTITDGNDYYINPVANSALATAGSGDVLTGIITGLLAQNYQALEAALLGVYLHSQTAEHYVKTYQSFSMTAGDIIDELKTKFTNNSH